MISSLGNAVGGAQLLGREPASAVEDKFRALKATKVPLAAQESGKSGKLPVKVKLVNSFKQPRDCQVLSEQFDGQLALIV